MTYREAAKMVDDFYRDYDPYDYDEGVLDIDEIAEMIAGKDWVIIEDTLGCINNCIDGDIEMMKEGLNLVQTLLPFYS